MDQQDGHPRRARGAAGAQAATRAWALIGAAGLVCALVGAALHWRAFGGPIPAYDDPYIVLSNARALLQGAPLREGEPILLGATSLLHTAGVALFSIPFRPETGLFLFCWLGAVAGFWGALAAARSAGATPFWGGLLALACFIASPTPFALVSGLETGWVVAALFWTFAFARRDPFSPAAAILCGMLPFIRPELGVFSCAMMGRALWLARAAPIRALRPAALALGVALALLALQWGLSGAPIPTTGSAKRAFFGMATIPPEGRALLYLNVLLTFFGAMGGLWLGALIPREGTARTALFAALALMAMSAFWYGNIAGQNQYRVLWDLVPPVIFACAAGLAQPWRRPGGLLARVALISALVLLPPSLAQRTAGHMPGFLRHHLYLADMKTWIDGNLAPGERIAVHDVGFTSWATDAALVDFVGLRSPENIPLMRAAAEAAAAEGKPSHVGRARGMLAAMEAAPVCIVMISRAFEDRLRLVSGAREAGWSARRLSPPEMDRVAVWRMTAPPGHGGPCAREAGAPAAGPAAGG